MSESKKVAVIILHYMEGNIPTVESLRACGYSGNIIWANRDGVGSMSRAFNDACEKALHRNYDYLWFLTNVTFPQHTMKKLIDTLDADEECAAVQPRMVNSDHNFLRTSAVEKIPFVEWTAPMFRIKALEDIGVAHPGMGYVHFDMEWSYRAMCAGYNLKVNGGCEINHKYLHSNQDSNFWTRTRKEMRNHTLYTSAQVLATTMGFAFSGLPDAEKTARKMCMAKFTENQNTNVL